MTHNRNMAIDWALKAYIGLALTFIFAPIAASFVFSFNVDRFPSLPLGGFFLCGSLILGGKLLREAFFRFSEGGGRGVGR